MLTKTKSLIFTVSAILLLLAAQCSPQAEPTVQKQAKTGAYEREDEPVRLTAVPLAEGEKLRVIATTSIVADVVKNVGGDKIALTALLPAGTDPHTFNPAPADLAAVADAHVVFANGMGLEEFLNEMIKNAGGEASVVYVSYGVKPRQFGEGEADPHTWTTPTNVMVFVRNIELTLSLLDPANARAYKANAEVYQAQLAELDAWVKEQIEIIPPENRELVTDHTTFGYYADRYGLRQIGAVIPAVSTGTEPSAKELADLEAAIKKYDAKAVFVGTSVNPSLSERVAKDMGVKLATLYTGSLGEAGSGAETYIDYIRYNTNAIVEALE